ncbi:MAG: hypothetical protein U5K73_01880 [Halofilum sp. (in: g-proteobacteria)]|nr:hypothetical protein [Halofilum sp. (in: g-proteobacteria)]
MTREDDPSAPGDHAPRARRAAIDLRRFEPHERVPLLEMSLAVLETDESLQATFESWPAVLVRYLERTYRDHFDWWFAGAGEEWCLLEIRRLSGPV